MRIHGVTADFATRAKSRDPGVTIDELVSMRIHGNRWPKSPPSAGSFTSNAISDLRASGLLLAASRM